MKQKSKSKKKERRIPAIDPVGDYLRGKKFSMGIIQKGDSHLEYKLKRATNNIQ